MPTFGHVFFGLCLLIPIIYFTKDKFSYKVAFIFLANQIFGPDIVHLFFITPFHSILGFLILAIPLSLMFSYSSRFSLIESDGLIPLKFIDDGIREVKWKNAYFVTIAGGFFHFFIDQFFHWERNMNIWPGIRIHHDQMLAWGGELYHVVDPLMLIGQGIVIITILLSLYYFKMGSKQTFKFLLVVSVISIALMLFVSTAVYGGEREFAVIVCSVVYFLIPLFLLMHVARDVRDNPNKIPDEPKIKREKLLNIIAIVSTGVAVFLVIYVYVAITQVDYIAKLLAEDGNQSFNQIKSSVLIIAYINAVVAILFLIGSIGLFFKSKICRNIVIATCLYFFLFAFPLAIALFLCEKDVKILFEKKE
jgi:hypothetical protein